jgi:pimeloyl-ACP methyl ester carboxylesterase
MPRAELAVIEDARHAVPVEKPDAFNATVEAFLEERSKGCCSRREA